MDNRPGTASEPDRYRLTPDGRTESGRALYLQYRFNPGATEALGWQLSLPDLDASAYDHLELWIRGDAQAGFAEALKLEFKQPLAGGRQVYSVKAAH